MTGTAMSGLPAEDLAAIRKVSEDFARLILARDLDALARLYTEDAVLMPAGHPAVTGRAAIREWMSGLPKLSRFEPELHDTGGRQDLAYTRGSYRMTLEPGGGAAPADVRGKFLEIRRRQPDGAWLIAVDSFGPDHA